MISASSDVFDYLNALPGFKRNDNLWYHVYPGQTHSELLWEKRMWNQLKTMSVDRQWS